VLHLIRQLLSEGYSVSFVPSQGFKGYVTIQILTEGKVIAQAYGTYEYLDDLIDAVYVQVPQCSTPD